MARKHKKASVLRGLLWRRSGPCYNKQVGDSCFIRIRLEEESEKQSKTVLVSLAAGLEANMPS